MLTLLLRLSDRSLCELIGATILFLLFLHNHLHLPQPVSHRNQIGSLGKSLVYCLFIALWGVSIARNLVMTVTSPGIVIQPPPWYSIADATFSKWFSEDIALSIMEFLVSSEEMSFDNQLQVSTNGYSSVPFPLALFRFSDRLVIKSISNIHLPPSIFPPSNMLVTSSVPTETTGMSVCESSTSAVASVKNFSQLNDVAEIGKERAEA